MNRVWRVTRSLFLFVALFCVSASTPSFGWWLDDLAKILLRGIPVPTSQSIPPKVSIPVSPAQNPGAELKKLLVSQPAHQLVDAVDKLPKYKELIVTLEDIRNEVLESSKYPALLQKTLLRQIVDEKVIPLVRLMIVVANDELRPLYELAQEKIARTNEIVGHYEVICMRSGTQCTMKHFAEALKRIELEAGGVEVPTAVRNVLPTRYHSNEFFNYLAFLFPRPDKMGPEEIRSLAGIAGAFKPASSAPKINERYFRRAFSRFRKFFRENPEKHLALLRWIAFVHGSESDTFHYAMRMANLHKLDGHSLKDLSSGNKTLRFSAFRIRDVVFAPVFQNLPKDVHLREKSFSWFLLAGDGLATGEMLENALSAPIRRALLIENLEAMDPGEREVLAKALVEHLPDSQRWIADAVRLGMRHCAHRESVIGAVNDLKENYQLVLSSLDDPIETIRKKIRDRIEAYAISEFERQSPGFQRLKRFSNSVLRYLSFDLDRLKKELTITLTTPCDPRRTANWKIRVS